VLVVATTCVIHHVEPRYLFGLYPIYFVALSGLLMALDRKYLANKEWLRSGAVVGAVVLALVGVGHVFVLIRALGAATPTLECPEAVGFLSRTMQPDDAVLTSSPWYVAWVADRATISLPTNGIAAVETVARHYGARWIVTGMPSIYAADARGVVASLIRARSPLRPVIAFRGGTCDVYRLGVQ
jgi:hypothetical protein